MTEYGTHMVSGQGLDSIILEVSLNLNNSVIHKKRELKFTLTYA